ncbi:MAG: hypothetical protein EOO76_10440 [Novosphingobium sp.]|nr:MAG: hypothetical protein EOO76_10440 [Novosphingobium sp.]
MRRISATFTLGLLLLLAGCSKGHREETASEAREPQKVTSIDLKESVGAPAINLTAAPGVAFDYRYAFVLPDTAISAVQERHAAACEKLGPQHCRIAGMRYTLVDEDEVRGQLLFKLDPALARNFGKEGIAAVEQAKGRLVDAAIEGNDVGSVIDQSQQRSKRIEDELGGVDKRLAEGVKTASEREELQRRAEQLRQQQNVEQTRRDEGAEMLANTPMTFNYAGKRGFSWGDSPIGDAWATSQSSFITMVSIILVALGALLPWVLLAALLVVLWRKTPLRNLRRKPREAAPASEA